MAVQSCGGRAGWLSGSRSFLRQVPKSALAERMRNGAQANGEAFDGRSVRAVKFASQDLPGHVQPGHAIRRQAYVTGLKSVEKLVLVLPEHVGEVGRATASWNDG